MVHAPRPDHAPRAVAIYIRWSTDEQTEGTTLEVQRERCSLYIRSQGWEPSDELVFVDEGYSGGSLDRPALTRLRQLVCAGLVDCVVAYSIDRLSRNLADITELIQKEWAGRATFRSATQPIGTDEGNPTGQLIFNILASFAEFERGLIRERTHSGAVRRAREGRYPGSRVAPFGYVRSGVGALTVDEERAAVVRRMFEMAVTGPCGQGPTVIARALNAQGIPAPAGGKWWAWSVREILRNPVYAGVVTFGRRKNNPAHQRDKSVPRLSKRKVPLVSVDGAVPALVERAVWDRVQDLERERAATYTKKGVQAANRSLLSGLVHCRCGGPLHTFYKSGRQRYYRCSRNAQAGSCSHEPGIYQADGLEQAVVAELMGRYGSRELRAGALAAIEARLSAENLRADYLRSLEATTHRLEALEHDLARLRRAARTGEIQLGTYEELKRDVEAERAELETRRRGTEAALGRVAEAAATAGAWRRVLAQMELWESLEVTQQREVLIGLVRRVDVYRRRREQGPVAVAITWEGPAPQTP